MTTISTDLSAGTEVLSGPGNRAPGSSEVAPAVFADGEIVAERFRVVRFLGQGGMGQVFEAEDLELGARVALKVVRPGLARPQWAVERLKREVHLARQVTHANVCRTFDLYQHRPDPQVNWGRRSEPQLFLTMELLAGETLSSFLRRRAPLSPSQALPLIRQMAEALDAAHRAGVVHRDFKSSNVVLVPGDGETRVVVTDFGLAQIRPVDEGGTSPEPADGGSRLAVRGTPAYLAPEILEGAKATPEADVYAFGLVLYEMLAGVLPFRAETPEEEARLRLESPSPSLRKHRPELPDYWDAAVLRCLERRPDRRYPRAGAALADLTEEGPRRWRHLSAAPALAAVLAIVVAVFGPRLAERDSPSDSGLPQDPETARIYNEGVNALKRYDLARARELLDQAAGREGSSPAVQAALAEVLAAQGHDAPALEAARRAHELAGPLPREERFLMEGRYREAASEWARAREIYRSVWTVFSDNLEAGLRLATVETKGGDPEAALAVLEAIRRRHPEAEEPRLDLAEAAAARARADHRHQLLAARRAAAHGRKLGVDLLTARALKYVAEAEARLGDSAAARATLTEALGIFAAQGDRRGVAEALIDMPTVFSADLRQEMDMTFEDAVAVFRGIGDRRGEALALVRLGRQRFQDPNQGEPTLDQALELAHQIHFPRAIAEALNALAIVAFIREDDEAASVERFEAAIEVARRSGNLRVLAGTVQNLANVLKHLEERQRALELYDEAIDLGRRIGDRPLLILALTNSTHVLDQIDESAKRCQEALELSHGVDDLNLKANARSCLGDVYRARGEIGQARRQHEMAIALWTDAGIPLHDEFAIIQCEMWAEEGDLDEAERCAREVSERHPLEDLAFIAFKSRLHLAEYLRRLGRVSEAFGLVEGLLPSLSFKDSPGLRVHGLTSAQKIEESAGRSGEIEALLRRLIAEASVAGDFRREAEVRLDLGRLLRIAGDHPSARAELGRVRVLAKERELEWIKRHATSELDLISTIAAEEDARR